MLPIGDFDRSFFLRLRFSGVASSGAESSTSKSLSGELGEACCRDGESDSGIEYDLFFILGLLGEDSEPVSWSVSAESRALLFPTANKIKNSVLINCQLQKILKSFSALPGHEYLWELLKVL